MISETYFVAFAAVAILELVGAVATIIGLGFVLPPRVEKKYQWTVRMKSKIPLVRNWEAGIDAEDVAAFRRYRFVLVAWLAAALVLAIVEFWLWLQMMQAT